MRLTDKELWTFLKRFSFWAGVPQRILRIIFSYRSFIILKYTPPIIIQIQQQVQLMFSLLEMFSPIEGLCAVNAREGSQALVRIPSLNEINDHLAKFRIVTHDVNDSHRRVVLFNK